MTTNSKSLLQTIAKSKSFELFVGLLTLSSVVLALVLYSGVESSSTLANTIYIFDFFVVSILAFDFLARIKSTNDKFRYFISHSYEIPAMIPLLVFVMLEDPLIVGAAVRSLRFVRLFRLIRLFRLANLFRIAEHWKLSTFVYLVIITLATVIFGAIAIFTVEDNNENIQDFEDALWFSASTLTISGYGDIYPMTTEGRIIATVLSFVGLAITLGFIANIGSALIESRLGKSQKRFGDELKSSIINKINNFEDLHEEEVKELVSLIDKLHQQPKTENTSMNQCSKCNNELSTNSVYCNFCGEKV